MSFIVVLVSCLLIGLTRGQTFAPGRLVSTRSQWNNRAIVTPSAGCAGTTNIGKKFCNQDADTKCEANGLFQCTSKDRFAEFDCPTNLKYCVEDVAGQAKCSNSPADDCKAESNFNCLSEGAFPDISNCKNFYYCGMDDDGGLVAEMYECDNLYVFDPSGPKNNFCRLTRNLYCTQYDCKGSNKNVLLKYTFFPKTLGQIVVSCMGTKPPLITRCSAGLEADLNTLPVECILKCTRAATAPFPGDSTKYFECVYNGRTWESKTRSCFKNFYYDPSQKMCVINPTKAPATDPTTIVSVAVTGATEAATGATEAATGVTEAATGATGAVTGATEAATGATAVPTGATEAATGVTEAATGATEAATGATGAATGVTEAATGATEAATGATEAATGATESATGATDATDIPTGATEAATSATEAATGATEATTVIALPTPDVSGGK